MEEPIPLAHLHRAIHSHAQPVDIKKDTIVVGGIEIPRYAKTDFKSLKGMGPAYTLEAAVFCFLHADLNSAAYLKHTRDEGVECVSIVDRGPLLKYLKEPTAKPDMGSPALPKRRVLAAKRKESGLLADAMRSFPKSASCFELFDLAKEVNDVTMKRDSPAVVQNGTTPPPADLGPLSPPVQIKTQTKSETQTKREDAAAAAASFFRDGGEPGPGSLRSGLPRRSMVDHVGQGSSAFMRSSTLADIAAILRGYHPEDAATPAVPSSPSFATKVTEAASLTRSADVFFHGSKRARTPSPRFKDRFPASAVSKKTTGQGPEGKLPPEGNDAPLEGKATSMGRKKESPRPQPKAKKKGARGGGAPVEKAKFATGLVYDDRMLAHECTVGPHPEQPRRISTIFARLEADGIVQRCVRIPAREATKRELGSCHTTKYLTNMNATHTLERKQLNRVAKEFNSVYLNGDSAFAGRLSCGGVLQLVGSVLRKKVANGFAVVRPPGHHAERDHAMGFCLFNNVAVAAAVATDATLCPKSLGCPAVDRVLIVDWDIHHGNGISRMFADNPNVMYFSVHRHDKGDFYPGGGLGLYHEGSGAYTGGANAKGFTMNVAWDMDELGPDSMAADSTYGDAEYLAVFNHVLMPMARKFNPDLVLVSAGFDAARGDPLGGCTVTPLAYANMTSMLMELANGKVVVALEGGYNLESISASASAVTATLLGDAPHMAVRPCMAALAAIATTMRAHEKWFSEEDARRLEDEIGRIDEYRACPVQRYPSTPLHPEADSASNASTPAEDSGKGGKCTFPGVNPGGGKKTKNKKKKKK